MDFDEALLTLEPPTFYCLSLMIFNKMLIDLLIDLSLPPGVFKISSENFPQKNDHNFLCIRIQNSKTLGIDLSVSST